MGVQRFSRQLFSSRCVVIFRWSQWSAHIQFNIMFSKLTNNHIKVIVRNVSLKGLCKMNSYSKYMYMVFSIVRSYKALRLSAFIYRAQKNRVENGSTVLNHAKKNIMLSWKNIAIAFSRNRATIKSSFLGRRKRFWTSKPNWRYGWFFWIKLMAMLFDLRMFVLTACLLNYSGFIELKTNRQRMN